jgi:hypothetical protein
MSILGATIIKLTIIYFLLLFFSVFLVGLGFELRASFLNLIDVALQNHDKVSTWLGRNFYVSII